MPVHRATFSLTGWTTDDSGNLVNTGHGALWVEGNQGANYTTMIGFRDEVSTDFYAGVHFGWMGWNDGDDGFIELQIADEAHQVVNAFHADIGRTLISAFVQDDSHLDLTAKHHISLTTGPTGDNGWTIDPIGRLLPTIANEVPATPTVQDVVDKLIDLGILQQAV